MFAVIRETTYPAYKPLGEGPQFRAFQEAHAEQPGYMGTIVTHLGDGRYVTVTLWDSARHMDAAREAIGPTVGKLLEPIMLAPSRLYGTGEVAYTDLAPWTA